MIPLIGRHKGQRALVVMGGPSVLANRYDLSRLQGREFVVFLESKALTPWFLGQGLKADYYLMFYPEKSKSNSLQDVIFRSLVAGIDLSSLLRPEFLPEVDYMKRNFDTYFYRTNGRMPHKFFRWLPDVFLPGSPFSLLDQLPDASLISFRNVYDQFVREQTFRQPVHFYNVNSVSDPFDPGRYFNPTVDERGVTIDDFGFSNSAAIALFPILKLMGFQDVYFLGMDMSMLGSLEFSSYFTFQSLEHFRSYYERARKMFDGIFPKTERANILIELRRRFADPLANDLLSVDTLDFLWRYVTAAKADFIRPRREFHCLQEVLASGDMRFTNVYQPLPIAKPVPGARNISFDRLLGE